MSSEISSSQTRRTFIKASTIAGAGALAPLPNLFGVHIRGEDTLRVGLIGCGGRGTQAASQALGTEGSVELVAMADMFPDRLEGSLRSLRAHQVRDRVAVDPAHCFVGFDAYKDLLASEVDVVLIATPPHFRPEHFRAAVAADKHVFMEKPVAVDGPGIRLVLETAEQARTKQLAVVSGLQRHHEKSYLETMRRVHDGDLGRIVAARCYWNTGGLWMKDRQPQWSDMEWQLRNWLYFAWLSGDHIVEQHVHNLDVMNWAMQAHPIRCHGMGGRQVRTDPAYGHIFDHHAVQYEYPGEVWMFSQCRQIDNCRNDVSEHLMGSEGNCDFGRGARITGKNAWTYEGGRGDPNPYEVEHDDLFASIRSGQVLNEGKYVAESTLTAIMGRMATYTGREITWEEALNSEVSLGPDFYEMGSLETPPVPMPGSSG